MAAFCASRVAVPVVSAKGGVVSKQVRAGSGASVVRGLSVDKATCHRPSVAIFRASAVRVRATGASPMTRRGVSPRAFLRATLADPPTRFSRSQSSAASAFHGVSVKSTSVKVSLRQKKG
jgi:hypothetical protein